jgi:putative hydrolases of HD superfamily
MTGDATPINRTKADEQALSELSFGINDLELLFKRIHILKHLPRQGWVRRKVPNPESVADHSYSLAMLTMVFAREFGLDVGRAIMTALVHDLAESVVGDIIPADNVDAEKKSLDEKRATKLVLDGFDPDSELYELWCDFEYGRTPEGRLVKELDRLEMVFQAARYETETGIDLSDFFPFVRDRISDPRIVSIFNDLAERRHNSLERTESDP